MILSPVGGSRTLCILVFFYFLKSMNMLKPLLSSSRSFSVCRVGEDGGSSSFCTRFVIRVVILLPGREFSLD